jgi:hypothetical protein
LRGAQAGRNIFAPNESQQADCGPVGEIRNPRDFLTDFLLGYGFLQRA